MTDEIKPTKEAKDLDPAPLVLRLIEKSRAGKVKWEATADRRSFVASVGGDTTFKVRMVEGTGIDDFGHAETIEMPQLDMLDDKGKLLWDVRASAVKGRPLYELYEVARRIGNRLDERLTNALSALDRL